MCDHFSKQTLRNRCWIDSPSGALALTVPVVKTEGKTLMRDIRISDHGNWRHQHWIALESSYRQSPFFDLRWECLVDFNHDITTLMCQLLDIQPQIQSTTTYLTPEECASQGIYDFRDAIRPKHPLPDPEFQPQQYYQVFGPQQGFLPNLSILDLLMNEGNESIFYL